MKQRVTIADVAKVAGVSKQTVSRAINNKGEISPETKERIMSVIAELGYRPNRMAQAMTTQQSLMVGLLIPDITNPFFAEVARGVQDAALDHDYNVLLCNTDGNQATEMRLLDLLTEQSSDAFIMWSVQTDLKTLAQFTEGGRPILVINQHVRAPGISEFMVDNSHGAQLAVEHFVASGRQHIAMLTNVGIPLDEVRRVQGFRDAVRRLDRQQEPEAIVKAHATLEGGREGTLQLFATMPHTDAIFTYNDLMALGAIRACHELGKRIPEDISIIGFDDIQFAAMSSPALSTVHVDKYALGQQAFLRTLQLLQEPNHTLPAVEFDISLKLRETTLPRIS